MRCYCTFWILFSTLLINSGARGDCGFGVSSSPFLAQIPRCGGNAPSTTAKKAFDGLPHGTLPSDLPEELYERAIVYGKLAAQAYTSVDTWTAEKGIKFGFRRNAFEEAILAEDFKTPDYEEEKDMKFDDTSILDRDRTGLAYSVFRHTETGDLVVAFRGTSPLSYCDWSQDMKQCLGGSEQYRLARKEVLKLIKNVETENNERLEKGESPIEISFTGHSLGGGLATMAALATGKEAIVFDAAGVSDSTVEELNLDTANESKVTNFNVQKCFVSDPCGRMEKYTLSFFGTSSQQYGKQYFLEDVSGLAEYRWKDLSEGPDEFKVSLYTESGWPGVNRLSSGAIPSPLASEAAETAAYSFLAHAWHVYTFQLENRNFVQRQKQVCSSCGGSGFLRID